MNFLGKNKKGFTLVEMLLVMAIIGILAGVIFNTADGRKNARIKSALSTAKSIEPYAQECSFKGESLQSSPVVGQPICPNSATNWPAMGVSDCNYAPGSATTWVIRCDIDGDITIITCDAQSGDCVVS
ncbi:MAG: type II secretion system protein [Candidatus Moranbacteria bacterium]|nr:type II secretion system protein [Candidatus Moranbacteria bacterium]